MSKRPFSRSGPFRTVEERSIGRERKEHFFAVWSILDFCTRLSSKNLLVYEPARTEPPVLYSKQENLLTCFAVKRLKCTFFTVSPTKWFHPLLKFPTVSGFQNQTWAARNCSQAFYFQEQVKPDQKAGTETGCRGDTIIRTGTGRVHKPSRLFSDVWMCLWVFSRLHLPILQAFWHHF